jgi:hypothetical protein
MKSAIDLTAITHQKNHYYKRYKRIISGFIDAKQVTCQVCELDGAMFSRVALNLIYIQLLHSSLSRH